MKTLPRRVMSLIALVVVSSCAAQSPNTGDYRTASNPRRITPQSYCYRDGSGHWICSGGGNPTPCDITSQTTATVPANRARTTIGVGEQVVITSNGGGLSASGTGGTLSGSASGSTLTAAATGGTVTIRAAQRGKVCTANTMQFTVIAPSTAIYNWNGNVAHDQGKADIGKWGKVYFVPDSVNFSALSFQELAGTETATGSWYCNPAHTPGGAVAIASYEAGRGWFIGQDEVSVGSCFPTPYDANQYLQSYENQTIPTQYLLNGTWKDANTVTMAATNDTSGNLTLSKDQMSGSTTVNSASSGF